MLKRKLQAGALFYATGISIVIAMLVMSVILCFDLNARLVMKDKIKFTVLSNAESGVIAALQFPESGIYNIDLFNTGRDSVTLSVIPWGLFDICESNAHTGNEHFKRYALLGNRISSESDYALWLADMDRPLFLCGATQINGKSYLPKSGVERAYIEGSSYVGSQLIYGPQLPSSRYMIAPNEYCKSRLEQLKNGIRSETDSILSIDVVMKGDTIRNSFDKATVNIQADLFCNLHDMTLQDNICIVAKKRIQVESCNLRNVILIAPEIIIGRGTYEGLQCFATDSIHLDSAVQLQYPSALVLLPENSKNTDPCIVIEADSKIGGDIIAYNATPAYNEQTGIILDNNSQVYGRIYCSDWIDLKGHVCGSVACGRFTLNTNSARYNNHLLNATIDNSSFSRDYASTVFFNSTATKRGIAKWLN